METHLNDFKAAVVTILGLLTAFWGWLGWLVVAWVAAMILDYITGTCAAIKAGTWSSKVARDGVWHKLGAILAVLAAGLLDLVLGQLMAVVPLELPFSYTALLCPVVIIWYILTEAGSIVENAGELGAPIPGWLEKAIAAFKDKVDAKGNAISDASPNSSVDEPE